MNPVQVPVLNTRGETVEKIEIREDTFGLPFNEAVVHQALVRQLANRRVGTANTKTRTDVAGSGRKLYPQKGTGRARRGGIRSPLLRGGGVVFGPHPRDYRQSMPKKMRLLALKCALSAKARDGELIVLDDLIMESPKTKEMQQVLNAIGANPSALIVTAEANRNVIKSASNIPGTKTLPTATLNVTDLISYRSLIMTVAAVRRAEQIWGASSEAN
ncbi:MAG: 50S ribosomal protein L4 [Dehalococcoidia bacterium]|nr:50S ribosomal protein L4 [Dehalococcoidia bacterium]